MDLKMAEGWGFADGPSFRRLRPRRFPLHAHDGCRTRDSRLVPFKHDESTLIAASPRILLREYAYASIIGIN
jgi:hypothetical protein